MRRKIVAVLLAGVLMTSGMFTGCSTERKSGVVNTDDLKYDEGIKDELLNDNDEATPIEKPSVTEEPGKPTPTKKPGKPEKPTPTNEPTDGPEPTVGPNPTETPVRGESVVDLSITLGEDYGDDFDAYLDGLYLMSITMDSLTLHNALENPEDYGIYMDLTLGGDDEEVEERQDEFFEYLAEGIEHFKDAKLDSRQKLKYNLLAYEADMYEYSKGIKLDYIVGALSQNGNVLSNVQTVFTEYKITEEKDLQEYIDLLKLVPDYLSEEESYLEKVVVDDNLLLTEDMLSNAKDVVNKLYAKSAEDSIWYIAFEANAEFGGFDSTTVGKYADELKAVIMDDINPALKKFYKTLESFDSETDEAKGLASFEGGKDYYAYVLEANLGTGMTPDEIYEYGLKKYKEVIETESDLIENDSSIYFDYIDAESKYGDDPDKIIESLIENSRMLFPDLGEIQLSLNYLDERQENSMVTAYYMPPQLDDIGRKVIKLNGSNLSDEIELYVTLSHEGIPGHLYQDAYRFKSPYFDEIDSQLTYLGYQEGWAMYVEKLAYGWCLENENVAKLYSLDNVTSYLLYALADIEINYYNASRLEFSKWFSDLLGYDASSMADSVYNLLVSDPGLYPAYGLGMLFMEDTVDALLQKGMNEADVYQKILELGQAPFTVLWDELGISIN